MSLREKELLLPRDMIVPRGKKGFKLLPKATLAPSPQGHDFSPREKRA
jgi:hypothetical protein